MGTNRMSTNRMSTNTTEGIETYPHKSSSIELAIESFVEATEAPESKTEPFLELIEGMATTIEKQSEQIEKLEDELKEERETRAKNDAEIKKRLTDVEDRVTTVEEGGSDATNPRGESQQTGMQKPETPLEDLVTVPQTIIDQESANTQRAVFVARDIKEYTRNIPAGRMIKSHQLATVLKAGTDCSGHTQTVARVMNLLADVGGEEVEIVERRGTKRLVFTEEVVDRLESLSSQEQSQRCDSTVGATT